MFESDLRIGRLPESVRAQAEGHGLRDEDCLLAARSDLALDGRAEEVWLVVTPELALALSPGRDEPHSGPFRLAEVERVRTQQTVGSGFLQFLIDGLHVDVVRFSNARRELFSRVRVQIERVQGGLPVQREALTAASELVCERCGLPLPGPGGACPRCTGGHGVFLRALGLMRPYTPYIAVILALLLVRVGLSLVPPYLVKVLVDRVIWPQQHPELLTRLVLALVGLGVLVCAANVAIGLISASVGTRIGQDLRQVLHEKLMKLDVEYFDRHSTGALMSRVLYDVDQFGGFVRQVAEGFLLNVLTIVGIGGMLFYLNWRLAILVLVPIPMVIVGTFLFWRRVYLRYYPVYDSRSKMSHLLSTVLSGIRLVRVFGQEGRERERFAESAGYMRRAMRSLQSSVAVFNPLMAFVFGLGGWVIWYYGGRQVIGGSLSPGSLLAFLSYISMFYTPIHALSMFSNWATGFLSAGQRVFEILDAGVKLKQSPSPVRLRDVKGAVEFRNVTFGYNPYNPVLKNVSFRIEPGQFVGIVGKSGSGKTTLVNLICRFYDPQEGQVLIDGVDVRELALDELRKQVSLVLQEPLLFRASIRENIVYGRPDADSEAVLRAAKAANAHDFIAAMPAAYDTRLGERGAGLSGGERQRITIARGLIREPRILILDEATSSVDTESEQQIQRALAEMARGRTTIVIAHRLSTLRQADYILVLDAGRIVESGTHQELLEREGLYWRLVKIQSELARLEHV